MSRTVLRFGILIQILLLFSCGKEKEEAVVRRTEMVEAVYSSVELQPFNVYTVNSSVSGFISGVSIQEGDQVKKGQVLLTIVNDPVRMTEENARLGYEQARQSLEGETNLLDELKLELRTARLKAKNDSLNYARIRSLREQNAASQYEADNALLALEVSTNNLENLRKRIRRMERELEIQLGQSKNNLSMSTLRTQDYVIKSNIDGKVFQITKEMGEYVNMQEPLAIVGNENRFKLEMLIDEVDISRIRIGQKVLVTLEAYPNKVYEARLDRIAPRMDERTQTFKVEASFVEPPSRLYMGLTGEGNIVINEKGQALVIPREFLQPGNKVETDKGIVTVKTGLSNWSYVEILSGLKEGDKIYKEKP
jgi:RND family efflux transporter MFP subunit